MSVPTPSLPADRLVATLRRLLNLEVGEGAKVVRFLAANALLDGGLVIGVSAADALFLKAAGAEALPWIYVASALLAFAYVPINARLTRRFGISRVLDATLVLVTLGNLAAAGAFWLSQAHPVLALPVACAVKVWNALWWIALFNLFWNFAEDYFTLPDAKRLFSLFSGGAALGAIAAGLLVGSLASWLPVSSLFVLWGATTLATLPVLAAIRRFDATVGGTQTTVAEKQDGAAALAELRRSPYARALAALMLVGMGLYVLADYQAMQVFAREPDPQRLAAWLGYLFAGFNALVLVTNFFLFNRLVLRLGVVGVALVTPPVYLFAFLALWAAFDTPAALAASLAYRAFVPAVQANAQALLFNAIPVAARKEMRLLLKGVWEQLAMGVVALALLVGAGWAGHVAVSAAGCLLALLALGLGLLVGWLYRGAIAENVRRDRLDLTAAQRLNVGEAERARLAAVALAGDPATTHEALAVLWRASRGQAIDTLAQTLAAAPTQADALANLVADWLPVSDDRLVSRLLDWRDSVDLRHSPHLAEVLAENHLLRPAELAPWLDSPDPAPKAAAACALLRGGDLQLEAAALQALAGLLSGAHSEQCLSLRALGHTHDPRRARLVAPYLESGDSRVRGEAVSALAALGADDIGRWLPALLAAVNDENRRYDALEALATLRDPAVVRPLLVVAGSFGPGESRIVERLLVSLGAAGVPATADALFDENLAYAGRAIAVRALAILAPEHLEAGWRELTIAEIARTYDAMNRAEALRLAKTPGLAVLERLYDERPSESWGLVLELMAMVGRLPAMAMIESGLRSRDSRRRGEALEAIELGLPRGLYRQVFPLLDGRSRAEALRERQLPPLDGDEIARSALAAADALEVSAAMQAAWDAEGVEATPMLRGVAGWHDDPAVKRMAVSLITRQAGDEGAVSLVEAIAALAAADPFKRLPLRALERLASVARIGHAAGDAVYGEGAPADGAYLVMAGQAMLKQGGQIQAVGPGQTFGSACLFGSNRREEAAYGEGLRYLFVPLTAVRAALQRDSKAALRLLEARWRPSEGDN